MSELTAVEFLKARHKMCQSFDECGMCPLCSRCGRGGYASGEDLREHVRIVEEWAENQPFIPRVGGSYWCLSYGALSNGRITVLWGGFKGGLLGHLMAINGFCYRTEAAAQAHAEEDLARIQALYDDMRERQENE